MTSTLNSFQKALEEVDTTLPYKEVEGNWYKPDKPGIAELMIVLARVYVECADLLTEEVVDWEKVDTALQLNLAGVSAISSMMGFELEDVAVDALMSVRNEAAKEG